MEEYGDYDKSAFYLPREYLPQPHGRARDEGPGGESGAVRRFHIGSAAVSREEIGSPVYPPARRELAKHGISCGGHSARQLTPQDYGEYDLLIGMDSGNLRAMHRICGGDPEGKMSLLMDHTARPGSVADPWYTDDFEATWRDVLEGCRGLLAELSGSALPSSPFPLP